MEKRMWSHRKKCCKEIVLSPLKAIASEVKEEAMKNLITVSIFGTVMLLAVTSLSTAQTSMGQTTDWPMFHHDPNHTGYTSSTAPDTNQLAWSYDIDIDYSSPAIANGKVFIISTDGNVYALGITTETSPSPSPEPMPLHSFSTAIVAGVAFALVVAGVVLLIYFKKRKH